MVHPGFDFPIHASAVGKAVFAFLTDEKVDLELEKKAEKFMPTAIVGKRP